MTGASVETEATESKELSPPTGLRLNERENAYDFIEESLRYAELGTGDPKGWKFAIILAAQGIELLLKARLAMEHPLLVWGNVDGKADVTVTVDQAIARLHRAGVVLDKEDISRLQRAKRLRNQFMHYEVDATIRQLEDTYADLFEFAHSFHLGEFGEELHHYISDDLYVAEAAMMEKFRRQMVIYQGSEVFRTFPSELVEAQFVTHLVRRDERRPRIRMGASDDLMGPDPDGRCHDCSVGPGQFHALRCDAERCPFCLGQLLSCDCDLEAEYADEIEWTKPSLAARAAAGVSEEEEEA